MDSVLKVRTNNPQLVIECGADVLLDQFDARVNYLYGQFHDLLCIFLLTDNLCIFWWKTVFQILDVAPTINVSTSLCVRGFFWLADWGSHIECFENFTFNYKVKNSKAARGGDLSTLDKIDLVHSNLPCLDKFAPSGRK